MCNHVLEDTSKATQGNFITPHSFETIIIQYKRRPHC